MTEKEKDLGWSPSEKFERIMNKDDVTPTDLKEALKECYIDASGGDKQMAINVLKKQFDEAGASWDDPTVSGIRDVMDRLADVTKNFRSEDVVKENYQKMMKLLRKKMDDLMEL